MKRKTSKYILALLVVLSTKQLFATAQFGDLLIIEGDTTWIVSNPLEGYFEIKGLRKIGNTEIQGSYTALWRGYVATYPYGHRRIDTIQLGRRQLNKTVRI